MSYQSSPRLKRSSPQLNPYEPSPNDKLQRIQQQTDVILDLMKDNVNKTLARGEDLEILEQKTIDLEKKSTEFHGGAKKIHSQQKCAYYRNRILIFLLIVVILVVILAVFGVFNK